MAEYHEMASPFHQRMKRDFEKRIVPVTLIGGFLGSGKTTMVNYTINKPSEATTDVLVREFSPLSIDDKLIKVDRDRVHPAPGVSMHIDEETMLYIALDRLHEERYGKFDHLLLETSGTESPEFFLHLFLIWDMPDKYRLDGLITLVDAEYGELNMNEFEAAVEQVAIADIVVINKTDLADEKTIAALEKRIRSINAMARIEKTTFGMVDLEAIKGLTLYNQLRNISSERTPGRMDSIQSCVLEIDQPLDKKKTNVWINNLFTNHGDNIIRSKGFLNFDSEDFRYEFQAVRKSFHSYAHDMWQENEKRKTVIVLIGTDLPDQETLMNDLKSCVSI